MAKRKRDTAAQTVRKFEGADRRPMTGRNIGQIVRHLRSVKQRAIRWRNQYGGMKAEEDKRPQVALGKLTP